MTLIMVVTLIEIVTVTVTVTMVVIVTDRTVLEILLKPRLRLQAINVL